MAGEEWKGFSRKSSIGSPVRVVPRSVVFFRLMRNSGLSQLAGESLVGIHVVKIGIGTIQPNFKPRGELRLSTYLPIIVSR